MDDVPVQSFPVQAPDNEVTPEPRFVVLREKHIGLGLRWCTDDYMPYPLHLSFALPFVTFEMGFGRRRGADNGS